MRTHARVVVIGGGIVGSSILYHLAEAGWSDVVLCERGELASGSTWVAAGLVSTFSESPTIAQLHHDSMALYARLEAETGQDVGYHACGQLRLAQSGERLDELRHFAGLARLVGVPAHLVTPAQVAELWPLACGEGVVGGLYLPADGYVAPLDATQALARGARNRGAEIYRNTEVNAVQRNRRAGEWVVSTDKGDISCDHIVTAMGARARPQVRRLFGIGVPVVPVEHQYLVTDALPSLVERHDEGVSELPVLAAVDESWYLREERQGLIFGAFEEDARPWAVDGPPENFAQELLAPDYDRLEPYMAAAMQRVPAFGEAGVRDCINGGVCYTPDGNPLVGPLFSLPNVWLAEGYSQGVAAAGGMGRALAAQMVEGDAGIDMTAVDPQRFGHHANRSYAVATACEAYARVYGNRFPRRERVAGRPGRQAPVYERQRARNAHFGAVNGWERANVFAPPEVGETEKQHLSHRRTAACEWIGDECRRVRSSAGLIDLSALAKHELSGPGAMELLQRLTCGELPRLGRTALAHALTPAGGIAAQWSCTRLGEDRFYLVSAAAAECHDQHLLCRHLPTDGSVQVRNVSQDMGVLLVAGPNARRILEEASDDDFSPQAFPPFACRDIVVGMAPVRALRVSAVGELGWELHHALPWQNHLFDVLMEAGEAFDLGPCGAYAQASLALEKSRRGWGAELTPHYGPLQAGLDRFVHAERAFIGREALERQRCAGLPNRFVTLQVAASDRDPRGNEPVYHDGRIVGRTTAGGYAYCLDMSLALGYVEPQAANAGDRVEVELLGERFPAEVVQESPYDPQHQRLRS